MAFGTRYPLQVDTNATIPASTGSTPLNPTVLNQLRDAIIAVEQELGVKPSGTYTTVRMRLDTMEGLLSSIVSGTVTFGGDLSGTTTSQTVVGIRGRQISAAVPSQGQALIYNGSDWIPGTNFFAQNITTTGILTAGPFYSTSSETGLFTLDGKIIINNIPTNSNLSNGGQAVIYYDQTSNKLKVSENGGAYQNLVVSGTSNVTWSTDLNGSTDLNQIVVALTGFNNITTIRSTSPTLQWVNTTLNPTITQDSSTGAGTTLSLLAQNAGGSNQAGGNLVLGAGIQSGSGTPGYVSFKSGSTEISRVLSTQLNSLAYGIGAVSGSIPTITTGTGAPASTPANGSIYLRQDGYDDTSLYTYEKNVWLSLQSQLALNVKSFGAVGDGTTDDTTAIQNAINYSFSHGRIIIFPGGDYRVTATITIPEACSLIGLTGAPPGGTNATGNGFPTIVHDFDGDLFVFNGAHGNGVASGGGIEGLRIVQKFGTPGGSTHRGSAIVLTAVDVGHRPSWIKLRKLLIEEAGNDPWTDAVHIDGYNAASDSGILDLFFGEISTHLSSPTSNAFYIKTVGTAYIYNSQLYLVGSNITVTGGGATSTAADVMMHNVDGYNVSFDYATDCSIYGGVWNGITTTSHTLGTNTFLPARLTNNFADSSGNSNTGALWYNKDINTFSFSGAFRSSKSIVLENASYLLSRNGAGNDVVPIASVDANNAILIGGRSSGHIITFGHVVNYNSAGTDDLITTSGTSLRFQNNAQNNTYNLIKSAVIDGYDSVVVGDSSARTTSLIGGLITSVRTVTSNYTVDGYGGGDYIVAVGTIGAPVTINLPPAPDQGRTVIIKDANGSSVANNITVSGNGNNIDGAASLVINQNYTSITFTYIGSQWSII